ncbi:hypothetical protein KP509_19G052900 [Ceratopteris richardii]|uniref:AIM24 family protein n=1 Tax=Ceratopteris richardii TaxID=49495 RepID=A0A8T2SPK6_CERRI|nr:hypothetical protein KP509_19G052900 [Ceratopteris richardii]KAH7352588.1 hypothetical protein KP509_19G052900 [Ceratopteris richardii]
MEALTLDDFVARFSVSGTNAPPAVFEVINDRFLRVNLGFSFAGGRPPLEEVWTKMGSMVAYTGELKFHREGTFEHGFKHALKKMVTDEGATLVKAQCVRPGAPVQLYLADEGKSVAVVRLAGDAIFVNGNDLLAFEPTINHKITMMRKISSVAAGGLFNVRLEGHGFVAILTHGKPITLPVAADLPPVFTDAEATVAWSGNVTCDFHTDFSIRTFFGRSSGESFQMKFVPPAGGARGFVIVQPFEEHPPPPPSSSSGGGGADVDVGGLVEGLGGLLGS